MHMQFQDKYNIWIISSVHCRKFSHASVQTVQIQMQISFSTHPQLHLGVSSIHDTSRRVINSQQWPLIFKLSGGIISPRWVGWRAI